MLTRAGSSFRATDRRGFTMIELLITLTVLAAVMVVLMTVMYAASRSKVATSNRVESMQSARIALDMMAKDLRSAGYGADMDYATPQRPIAYIDSIQVLLNSDMYPYPDSLPGHIMGRPQAYDPAGAPRPRPLDGTAWQPPIKYRRGAETIRWTMDVNNDGKTDSLDWQHVNGQDAMRTPNRGDYTLVRQVFGDSVGDIAGNNWGFTERVALVQRPAASGVPPMFNVYLAGSNTKWDWSNGPIPANQLGNIDRIELNVVSASSKPDSKGGFASTRLTTQVSSMRNVPNFGATLYNVDGYVFDDNVTQNGSRDPGEPGVPGASVRLGVMSTVTDVNGYFLLKPMAGTYTLRHVPPPAFANATNPDSFVITVGPATSRSFADTARAGGWVTSFTYDDRNGNGTFDGASDTLLRSIKVTVSPGNDVQYTDNSGFATNFAPAGPYTVTATPPDSFSSTTTNPVSGVMSNGGTASYSFGFQMGAKGTVKGTVFTDANRNGNLDVGETGISGVWVGVTPDAGLTVLGYQNTDANGNYSIDVPSVSSPSPPYYVMTVVKPGFFPTGSTSLGPFYLAGGQILTGYDFGEVGYQVITLTASRVLSLASADVIEKDWSGNQSQNRHGDSDLILGADAAGTDQLSVWFNQYSNSPLFDPNPTYTRTAQSSVLAMAVDTLDNTSVFKNRPDVATGTKDATSGNFFVWLTQGSSGNEGYVPTSANLAYRTSDAGDVQSILSYDCSGGPMPDLIVGTKSPTANQGTIEVWENDEGASPAFKQDEIYPPNGYIPLNQLGEVTAMALADFDGDGLQDLVVGTKTGNWSGQLMFFQNKGRTSGARFIYQCGYDLPSDAVTSITCFDIDGDSNIDVIVGTQRNTTAGHVQQWGNKITAGLWLFALDRAVTAPGIVLSLVSGDFGATGRGDVAVGWRADTNNYVGGVRVYFCDALKLPATGSDPSGGSVVNMVPALTTGNFNYGINPATAGTPLTDIGAGVKISATTGALVVYIR